MSEWHLREQSLPSLVGGERGLMCRVLSDAVGPMTRHVLPAVLAGVAPFAKRLARYKKDIRALAPGHTLVEANFTDNNGFTVYALLPVKNGQVTAFLTDEKFEH